MPCLSCALSNQVELSAEMIVHHGGLSNLDNSGVLVFPKVLVCLECGFARFKVPETELALLAAAALKSQHLAAGGGR